MTDGVISIICVVITDSWGSFMNHVSARVRAKVRARVRVRV